jgi:hypothetical protein
MRPPGFERLRSFLRRAAPAHVVIHTDLGDRTLQCKSGAWREVADTIVSMKPNGLIEAFDPKGVLLRTFECGQIGEAKREGMPLATSQLQSDMQLYQRLLAEAYRHANETAFGQVVRLCEIAFKRLETVEVSWARVHRQRAAEIERANEAAAGEEPDMAEEVLTQMAKGMLEGQLAAAMNGKGSAPATKPKGTNGRS